MLPLDEPAWSNPNISYNYVLETLPCRLPHAAIDDNEDLSKIAADAVKRIPVLTEYDFAKDPIWNNLAAARGVTNITLSDSPARINRVPNNSSAWVTVDFSYQTSGPPKATNLGQLSLTPANNGEWKIWMITTYLDQLLGHPSVDELAPSTSRSVENGSALQGSKNTHFEAVVIGAGQAGLSVGGRLKALGVSYIVVDKMQSIGDNWMLRYDSTRLHTTREFAHLPFDRTFGSEYQEYLTKQDVAKGFIEWVNKFNIEVWLSTSVERGEWDPERKLYTLTLNRNSGAVTVTCRHVVMATGGYSPTRIYPQYENKEMFKGLVMHSEDYKNCHQWKGKAGVVVGTANTAHDVAEDMLKAGMNTVWMIQRDRTFVIPATHFKRYADGLYNPQMATTTADRISYTVPWAISRQFARAMLHPMAAEEPERYDSLEKANFKVTQYGDLIYNLSVRRGGHYMDVGCSELISKGFIKVKSDSLPVRYKPDGLECADGTFIPADVVVFATGFSGSLIEVVEGIFGTDVAANLGVFWGLDNQGEIRNAFVPTKQPGLWAAAGTIGHSRYHSRFIALQIAADVSGTPFTVYSEKS